MGIILTEEQLTVVQHPPNAHGRVLAGPGTGKSTTAVALAELLLAQENPPRVRFLTFTRAATAELSKKLPPELSHNLERPSTIHSFAISVLLQNYGCASIPEPLRIPDDYEYWDLIRPHLAKQVRVPLGKFDDLIAEMSAMWQSLNPEERSNITPEERAGFMGGWNVHRRVFGYTLLQELPDLLRQALLNYDNLKGIDYDTLIVDEYQDLNACDLAVLK